MRGGQPNQALTLTQRIISESHNSSPIIILGKSLGRHVGRGRGHQRLHRAVNAYIARVYSANERSTGLDLRVAVAWFGIKELRTNI